MQPLILRNTFLSYFCSCQKKAYWVAVRRLFPMKTPSPLDTGSCIHEGLKVYHHPLHSNKPTQDRLSLALNQVSLKVTEEKERHDDGFDSEEVERILRGYAAEYPKFAGRVLSVEQEVSFQMSENIHYRGTIDMLVRDEHEDLIMWEHKSARALSANLVQFYSHSPQTLGYCYCLQNILNEEVKYVLFNFLVKTKKPTFHQEKVLTQKKDLLQWRDWAYSRGQELEQCVANDSWSENRYQCYPFIGKACPYVPLCWYGESEATLAFFREETSSSPSDALVGDEN